MYSAGRQQGIQKRQDIISGIGIIRYVPEGGQIYVKPIHLHRVQTRYLDIT